MIFGRLFGSSRRSRILKILDEERQILLEGPLSRLEPLVARREKAITELTASGASLPKEFLVALREKVAHNQSLLAASLDGILSARAQLEAIAATAMELGTYTVDGAPGPAPLVRVTRDQRA